MNTREQFTLARRYLRTEPSLFNPEPDLAPGAWAAAQAALYKRTVRRDYTFGRRGREVIEWHPQRPRVTYGCHCDSCMLTSRYARSGFKRWPCDAPKGSRKATAEYRAHEAELWDGVRRSAERFKPGAPPSFPSHTDLVHPITPAPKFVHDWINARGPIWKSTGPALPGPDARPHAPGKARKHFHAPDRQRETARIYAMPKAKPKRSRGRPAIPGRFVVVKLEERLIEKAEKLGGKVAAGIRKALERARVA